MALIPDDIIQRVLAAHDVVEVVGRFVQLKQAGRAFKALCPFHDEKTPSFTVNPDRQSFKCFGCGKGGTVITFVMLHHRLAFPEAVRWLARERGIEVPESGGPAAPKGEHDACLKAVAFAQAQFVAALASEEGAEARRYLEKRGFPPEAQERFGLGYAPAGWDRLLNAAAGRRIDVRLLETAGLVVPRTNGSGWYDRFRHRITFPVRNHLGQVVTFGARALAPDDTPKYLNGPETPIFKKGATLFGLDLARAGAHRRGEIWLMEGYADVLMAHRFGFDAAVAGMGTAFTPQQAGLMRRHANRVVLVYDADDAGRAAAEKALDLLLEEGLEVKVASLPEGKDVDEILLEEGAVAFQAVLDASQDLLTWRFEALRARLDLTSPRGRALAAQSLAATVARVKSPVERDFLLRAVVEKLGGGLETEQALRRELAERAANPRGPAARALAAAAPSAPAVPSDPRSRVRAEQQRLDELLLLAVLAGGGAVGDRAARAVGPEDFAGPARLRIYNAVLALREGGDPHETRVLLARFADDPDASAELADLPQGDDLVERAERLIDHLERRRREERRREAGRQALGAADQVRPLNDILDARPQKPPSPTPPPSSPPPSPPRSPEPPE
jgi:DNA primase